MKFFQGLCKKNLIIIVFAAMTLSMVTAGSALGAMSDYYGTYAGTFSGDDSGYWVAVISAAHQAFLSYSTVTGYGDGGYITYSTESGSIGEFYSYSAIQGSWIDPIYVDSTDGSVSGQWSNYTSGDSGTFSGSEATESTYAGSYSGSIGGDATGSWQMTVGSDGYITGSVSADGDTASFEGGVHPLGYFAGVGTIGGIDFAVYGQISGSSVSGGWISDDGGEGTLSSGGAGGGGGGGGGGGCFISTSKRN